MAVEKLGKMKKVQPLKVEKAAFDKILGKLIKSGPIQRKDAKKK